MIKNQCVKGAPVLFFLCLLQAYGCSRDQHPPLSRVSGKVTSSGKPLVHGQVCFMSSEGFGASAIVDADGNYSLRSQYGRGIPVGTYKVIVTAPVLEEATPGDTPSPSPPNQEDRFPEIPKKYRDFSTTNLQLAVQAGEQTFDLDLQN